MAFSFNPGQTVQPGTVAPPPSQPVSAVSAAAVVANNSGMPSVPDSPFLFMRYRGQEMTINAYLQILLVVISVLMVATSLIMFAYSQYLSMSIESKKQEIKQKDLTFKEYPVEDMKRLSKRFSVLNKFMQEYISIRSPLKLLENVVEKQVVFDDFSFMKPPKESNYLVSFKVLTTNYKALVQQLESLNLAQYSKVIPKTKVGTITDGTTGATSNSSSEIKVQVTAPIFAQGRLSDELDFSTLSSASSSRSSVSGTSSGAITP